MTSQATGQPGDWRRRRRSSQQGTAPQGDESQDQGETAPDQKEDAKLSRTLFSFLEPSLDRIGVYGAPMVLAGVIGLDLLNHYLLDRLLLVHL